MDVGHGVSPVSALLGTRAPFYVLLVLGPQQLDVRRSGFGVMLEEVLHLSPSVGEEYLVDEVYRGRGAFDIQQDRADTRVRKGSAHSGSTGSQWA